MEPSTIETIFKGEFIALIFIPLSILRVQVFGGNRNHGCASRFNLKDRFPTFVTDENYSFPPSKLLMFLYVYLFSPSIVSP
jgi:hypothetical protein